MVDGMLAVTRGDQSRIPLLLIYKLMTMIHNWKNVGVLLDYFHVFDIYHRDDESDVFVIEHYQEQPECKEIIKLKIDDDFIYQGPITIFCIDSEDYCTILLSEEY